MNNNLEPAIKSSTKVVYVFPYIMTFLICLLVIAITISNALKYGIAEKLLDYEWGISAAIVLLVMVFAMFNLTRITSVAINNRHLSVSYPFLFKRRVYSLDSVRDFTVEVTTGDGGDLAVIEFPFKKLTIDFADNVTVCINSKKNTNVEKLIEVLEVVVASKNKTKYY
ncbi:hypothetical protein EYV94_10900 [Puteibacter caeruleilacunae]|nr:hypothetical protein EYV94_10900 [Puteibacter caeruleilacunae]